MTSDEMSAALQAHHLNLRRTPSGEFVCESASGTRLHKGATLSPEEAVSMAVESLAATIERREGRAARLALIALRRARYYARPRTEAVPGPDGPRSIDLFDILLKDGSPTPIVGRADLIGAILEAEAWLAEDRANARAERAARVE